MIQIIERDALELIPYNKEEGGEIERRELSTYLTPFEAFWLKKTGDLLRPKDSQNFWNGNSYCWWEREYDEKGNPVKDHEFSVCLDKRGNCYFEEHDSGKIYAVRF